MDFTLDVTCKIRYRQQDIPVHIKWLREGKITATFETPIRAITPGQTIAIYHQDELL